MLNLRHVISRVSRPALLSSHTQVCDDRRRRLVTPPPDDVDTNVDADAPPGTEGVDASAASAASRMGFGGAAAAGGSGGSTEGDSSGALCINELGYPVGGSRMDQHWADIAAWKWLPKAHLHLHLEGAVRFNTVLELASLHGRIPAGPMSEGMLRDHFLTDRRVDDLNSLLDRFARIQELFVNVEVIERVAYEIVVDSAAQNIRLLEIRYAPAFLAEGHSYSWDEALAAIEAGIRRANI